jgi:hypothetical protein
VTIDERIRVAASAYVGWAYRAEGQPARVAEPGPWVPASVVRRPVEPEGTDCCTFVAGVLSRACPGRWPADAWAQAMILDARRPWSTVECPVSAGVAREVGEPIPGHWHVVQGWSGLRLGQVVAGATGHTWLQWGDGLVLEASSAARRVRWRSTPWAYQRRRYDEVRIARLLESP